MKFSITILLLTLLLFNCNDAPKDHSSNKNVLATKVETKSFAELIYSPAKAECGLLSINGQKCNFNSIYSFNEDVNIGGWAIDWLNKEPAQAVYISINDEKYIRTQYNLESDFVNESYKSKEFGKVRFQGTIPSEFLAKAKNEIRLRIISVDNTHYYKSEPIYINKK